ncbi:unnamed protein product [Mytilus coruscus]|uniref:Uncharacterized protein n=1 Tax=Mytilus coruscus TaxID=42192 RepID=A0A6J8AEI0_MYTCO|nr:unnamed protein product [Mytilus coruscus]
MSKQVMRHVNFLSLWISAEDEQRLAMIKAMNNEQFKILLECIYNILHGGVTLSPLYKKKLFEYKTVIRKITAEDTSRIQQTRLLLKYRSNLIPTVVKIVFILIPKHKYEAVLQKQNEDQPKAEVVLNDPQSRDIDHHNQSYDEKSLHDDLPSLINITLPSRYKDKALRLLLYLQKHSSIMGQTR